MAALTLLFLFAGLRKVNAAPTDYLDRYFQGTVTSESGTTMYTEPGTANPAVTDDAGNSVVLENGTKLMIYGEEYDDDLDIWYKCTVEVDGKTFEGFVFTGRVTRDNEGMTFTPTPTPEPTEAPAVTQQAIESDKETESVAEPTEETKTIVEDAGSAKPWIPLIVVCIIIVIFMLVYTIWVKFAEEKLEKEMEVYGGRSTYEPLDGESEEDFMQAKSQYFDSLGLGDASNTETLAETIGGEEDIDIDMSEFDDTDSPVLSDLIKSLEGKDESTDASPAFDPAELLSKLNSLSKGDKLVHDAYGTGMVIDNTDAEIIQVQFGEEMKFLKKEKLASKGRVKF